MTSLFSESDFALFAEYAGKQQYEAPEGHAKLRPMYDKLGLIAQGLYSLGYPTEIIRNPLRQAGQGTMAYSEYHWARVYPKDSAYYTGCKDIIFFVIGTTEDGFNIHIDSNLKKHPCNDVAEGIKGDTWFELSPQEASQYSCDELVNKCEQYINDNWLAFNQFGKEFEIKECIDYLKKMSLNSIRQLLVSNHNLILTGAPGTGKTYMAKEIAQLMGAKTKLVQFHPSYDYTDFVEGLRPTKDNQNNVIGFQRIDGVFKAFCREAIESYDSRCENNKPYVFIIDEINRGEISKIFGELFYSIDHGYRGAKGKVETQYQNLVENDPVFGEGFYVPDNVYIIGTMNDIDRSVESMDFAMRRRFAWKEITAKASQAILDSDEAWEGKKPSEDVLKELKNRMDNLNAAIIDRYENVENITQKDKIGLGVAYQIGAAYFLKYALYNDFDQLWENHLRGLLYEYLRGATGIDVKIERLHLAYNDSATH